MGRGNKFSMVLAWFREASVDEVRAIMPLVIEACGRRHILIDGTRPRRKRLNGEPAAKQTKTMEATA